MKKRYILSFLLFISLLVPTVSFAQCGDITVDILTNPGPYDIDTLTEADGLRNGPDYNGATVYYPTNATPPYSSMAIVPGFTAEPSSVADWGPFYASHGIVTIIIGTNSPFDFPEARALALLDALETIKQENTRLTSPLEGMLDINRLAVSGWSMGGGGAQRAAVLDNSIKAVVALCPYLLNPQLDHASPLLIFSGEDDTVAPPSQHANVHYNATPQTTDKLLFEIVNGDHSIANTPNGGNGVVGKIALSWLRLNLEDDTCYCPLLTDELLDNPPAASSVLSNFECEILEVEERVPNIDVYPNPTKNSMYVNIDRDIQYTVYSPFGQRLLEGTLRGTQKQIDLSQLPAALYYVQLENVMVKVIKE